MKTVTSFRVKHTILDTLDKIKIKEKITRTDALDKVLALGLEAYFKENETSGTKKDLSIRFDDLEKKMEEIDLKSFITNTFLADFVKEYFQDNEKFTSFNNNILDKMDEYKKQIQLIPKLGIIALKYVKEISNRKIPTQFCDEIKTAYLAIMDKN
jgi:hypothetical protein